MPTDADLPPYDPARLLAAPFPERVRLVCRSFAAQAHPTPRIVMAMYFREPTREAQPQASGATATALTLCALLVLLLGLLPGSWLDLASSSAMIAAAPPAP